MKLCNVDGCTGKSKTRGMCNRHYLKWWIYGDPLAGKTLATRGTGYQHSAGYHCIGDRLVHRDIAAKKIGRPLRRGEVVHHIDGNRRNNHPDNLHVFASQAEHAAHHAAERRNTKE